MDLRPRNRLVSLRDLPSELAAAMQQDNARLPKRERTRRQLLAAAVSVFSARGIAGATMQEIGATAEMSTATVYNHFSTRDEVVHAVAAWLAETMCTAIAASYDHIGQAAERMSIGNRRYIWLAEQSPSWALLLLDVMDAAPAQLLRILEYPLGAAPPGHGVAVATTVLRGLGVPFEKAAQIAARPLPALRPAVA